MRGPLCTGMCGTYYIIMSSYRVFKKGINKYGVYAGNVVDIIVSVCVAVFFVLTPRVLAVYSLIS